MNRTHFLLIATLLASPVGAQGTTSLTVAGATRTRAEAARDYGFVAYPITVLAPLGFEAAARDGRIEVRLPGITMWFRPGYSTFADNGLLVSLNEPAFVRDGMLYLPEYFYTEWLPKRHPRGLRYVASTRTLEQLTDLAAEPRQASYPPPPPGPPVPETAKTTPDTAGRTRANDAANGHSSAAAPIGEEAAVPSAALDARRASTSRSEPAVEMHVRVSAFYSDNFFQAPSYATPSELLATSADARVVLRIPEQRTNVQARVSRTVFDGFAPSTAIIGGFDANGTYHVLEATGGYQRRSPRLGIGDEPGFASSVYGSGSLGVKLPLQMQVSMLGHYYDIYVHARAMDSRFSGAGGALRYRGFGYRFSPEVGQMRSTWSSSIASENYLELSRWVSIRATPVAPVWLHARYRRDSRQYTVPEETSSNFGRVDAREVLTLVTDIKLGGRLTWGVYYTHEDGTSTRAGRTFTTQSITTGLSYRVR